MAEKDFNYQAMDCHNCYVREQLARQALEISQDCADAYNLLAEETSDSAGQELDLYTKAAEAGARALGARLKEWDGELRLNKNDNQGIRYTLLTFYAEKNELEKMDALL